MALEEVLRNADVVSVHLRLSDQSRNLLNGTRLQLMKKSAYLVNTARRAVVDETALIKMLKEKAIAGAALDVFGEEPLPPDSALLDLDNIVLTPHVGWPTDRGYEEFAEHAVENILGYMDGKVFRAINPEAMEKKKVAH
jgi:phosphoglycerate dehydrogenase-like enzyme